MFVNRNSPDKKPGENSLPTAADDKRGLEPAGKSFFTRENLERSCAGLEFALLRLTILFAFVYELVKFFRGL